MSKDPRVAARRREVRRLWQAGETGPAIAERVGASRETVSMDLYTLRMMGLIERRHKAKPVAGVAERRERVVELWNRGLTQPEIERLVGAPETTVKTDLRWLRVSGRIEARPPSEQAGRRSRRQKVERLWREGVKSTEIAKRLGIARSTVYMDLEYLRADGREVEHRIPALANNECYKGGK